MILRQIRYACALISVVALCLGCEKSAPAPATPPKAPARTADTILSIHWLGKKKISADTNAVELMQIWNLPESTKLEAQTLEKLSLFPWRLHGMETNQAATNLLRPLLEDLVAEESYFEVQIPAEPTNAAPEMTLAVRLDSQKAGLWETNLARVVGALTGVRPMDSLPASSNSATTIRWSVKNPSASNVIEFARTGDWVVFSAGQEQQGLLDEITARIQRDQVPFSRSKTNAWLDVLAELPRVAAIIGEHLPAGCPSVSLSFSGEDSKVRTRCQLNFPDKTPLVLDPWKIPTNMIPPTLSSFTAVRGFKASLGASKFWNDLHIGEPPNQVCAWAALGSVPATSFASPVEDASSEVSKAADLALAKNSWLAGKPLIIFRKSQKFNGLEWHGLPFMSPFLESMDVNSNSFILGGLMWQAGDGGGPPPTLIPQFDHTNVVAYDWEMTGQRINQWLYIGQFVRLVSEKAQLAPGSLSLAWLRAAAARLNFSATQVTETAPDQLSLLRDSSMGLTAIELNLLADWLESPEFPRGLYTLLVQPPVASPAPAPH